MRNPDPGDDQQHERGQRVDVGGDARLEVAGDDPREERGGERPARPRARGHRARGQERAGQRRHRDPVRAPTGQAPEEDVGEGAGQRKGGNQPDGGHRVNLSARCQGCQATRHALGRRATTCDGARDERADVLWTLGASATTCYDRRRASAVPYQGLGRPRTAAPARGDRLRVVSRLAAVRARRARHRAGPEVPRPQRLGQRHPRGRRGQLQRAEVRIVQGGTATTIAAPRLAAGAAGGAADRDPARRARPEGRRGDHRGVGRRRLLAPAQAGRPRAGLRAGDDRPHAAAAGAAGRHALHLTGRRGARRVPRARRLPRRRERRHARLPELSLRPGRSRRPDRPDRAALRLRRTARR